MKITFSCLFVLLLSPLFSQNELLDTLPSQAALPHDEVGYTGNPFYKVFDYADDIHKDHQDTLFSSNSAIGVKIIGVWLDSEHEEFAQIVIQIKKENKWVEIYIEPDMLFDEIEVVYHKINHATLIQLTYNYNFNFNRGYANGSITEIWNPETKTRYAHLYIENFNEGSSMDAQTFISYYAVVDYVSEITFKNGILTVIESKNLDMNMATDTNDVETIIHKYEGFSPKTTYKLEKGRFVKQ